MFLRKWSKVQTITLTFSPLSMSFNHLIAFFEAKFWRELSHAPFPTRRSHGSGINCSPEREGGKSTPLPPVTPSRAYGIKFHVFSFCHCHHCLHVTAALRMWIHGLKLMKALIRLVSQNRFLYDTSAKVNMICTLSIILCTQKRCCRLAVVTEQLLCTNKAWASLELFGAMSFKDKITNQDNGKREFCAAHVDSLVYF